MAAKYYDTLSDMGKIKDSLMSLFYNSYDIKKLVMPKLDNENFTVEQNWYGGTFETTVQDEPETTTLIGHCFDTPYVEGTVSDNRCAVFIETYLTKMENQHIKEVGVDIMVICHRDSVRLSDEDKEYFNSIGVYGNRVDSTIQVINSSILNHSTMDYIKKNYSIGDMNLAEAKPLRRYMPGTEFYGKYLSYTYQSFYKRKVM